MNTGRKTIAIWTFLILLSGLFTGCKRNWETRRFGSHRLHAGAAQVDISPVHFPALVNGYFHARYETSVRDPLYAKCIVLKCGKEKVAITVIDNLFLPRDFLDGVKDQVSKLTGIRTDRVLISATHTHTAPAVAACLGAEADSAYTSFLEGKIVEAIQLAHKNLEPARAGWAVVEATEHTHCRRWIARPDKLMKDAFGLRDVRANMHPGYQNPDFIGPAGPADKDLSILAIRASDDRPLAILANYSMHFCGSSRVSADYYGKFAEKFTERIGATDPRSTFVAIMSQGTSGDLHWNDYSLEEQTTTLEKYGEEMAGIAFRAYKEITYQSRLSLKMLEKKVIHKRRIPDVEQLDWARAVIADVKWPDITDNEKNFPWSVMLGKYHENEAGVRDAFLKLYAREMLSVAKDPVRELKLQVIQLGDLAITAIPCEVYGITGLKIKAQSPVKTTFNMGLANGAEGYIPPPEQHRLGGYTTWLSRTSNLEVEAEPRIMEDILTMLEELSGRERNPVLVPQTSYDRMLLAYNPLAYWPMNEMSGRIAADISGHQMKAGYEEGVLYYLDGPAIPEMKPLDGKRGSVHFVGGRMVFQIPKALPVYSVDMWFWNGLSSEVRDYTGFLYSQDSSIFLGIGGNLDQASRSKLILKGKALEQEEALGHSSVQEKAWYHLLLTRDKDSVAVYLNGIPEIRVKITDASRGGTDLFFGGIFDRRSGLEGRLCNVALFDRVISPLDTYPTKPVLP